MSSTMYLFDSAEDVANHLIIMIAGSGTRIDSKKEFADSTEMIISVPEHSWKEYCGVEFAGEYLAKEMKKFLEKLNPKPLKLEYKIRNGEYWTKEMQLAAERDKASLLYE